MTLFVNNAFKSFAVNKNNKGRRSPISFNMPIKPKKMIEKKPSLEHLLLMAIPVAIAAEPLTIIENKQQDISSKNNTYTMEEINENWEINSYDKEYEDYEDMWAEYDRLCEMYD
jgi:hypothetical protein